MKTQYGLILALLLGSGQLLAAEPASDTQKDAMPDTMTQQDQATDSQGEGTAMQPDQTMESQGEGTAMQPDQTMDSQGEGAAMQPDQAMETQGSATEQTGFSSGSVMRSAFTTRIENREPAEKLDTLGNATREVYYFTELRDMEGQTAKHRWEYKGEVMAEVEFNVNGPRWRVWSSKRFVPDWTGEWTVSVVNAAGEVIDQNTLQYVEESQSSPVNNSEADNMQPETDNTQMDNAGESQ